MTEQNTGQIEASEPDVNRVQNDLKASEFDVHGLEQHGIDLIPPQHRWGKPRDLLWFWMGVTLNIEFLVFGGLLPVIGLSLKQSIVAILIGNLAWFVTGLTSLQGPATGTNMFTISRASFGIRGGRIVAFFCWISMITYETIGLALIVLASLTLLGEFGFETSVTTKLILIPLAAILQLILPFLGHAWIIRAVKALVGPFVIMYVVLAILALPQVEIAAEDAPVSVFLLGLAIVGATGGLAFVMLGSDYSRYLPADSSKRSIVWNVGIGGYLSSTLVMALGAAVGSLAAGAFTNDPVSNLSQILPAWFIVPYLIVVIAQVYSINAVDLYSSALSLQSVGIPLSRTQCVLLDTVVCTIITTIALYSDSFNRFVANAALFMMIWIAPWVGIYLTDWLLRKGRYNSSALLDTHGGIYWRNSGWHMPALYALLAGMVAAILSVNTTIYVGPLSTLLSDIDISIPLSMALAAGVYFVMARTNIRRDVGN